MIEGDLSGRRLAGVGSDVLAGSRADLPGIDTFS
jgi:hypothetical protein